VNGIAEIGFAHPKLHAADLGLVRNVARDDLDGVRRYEPRRGPRCVGPDRHQHLFGDGHAEGL
jgi:hypothetical protein